MPYLVGVILAVGVCVFATAVGFDRDRTFYPVLVIVIACLYCLFAVMSASTRALLLESVAMTAFALAAIVGFRSNLWWVVAALLGHGVFDSLHARLIADPGVPPWWPAFCLTYDGVAAAYLAWRLRSGGIRASARDHAAVHPSGNVNRP